MTISNDIKALDDLIVKQDVETLLSETAQIADKLEAIWRFLDENAWRLTLASDRAAMSRISQAARDFVLATRPQLLPRITRFSD